MTWTAQFSVETIGVSVLVQNADGVRNRRLHLNVNLAKAAGELPWDVLGARARRGAWARRTFKNERQREQDMTIYPVEFHRRLEQKWASRIDQVLIDVFNRTPPRNPNDDDGEDEDEKVDEDEEQPDEPPVIREPDED
jgi:hypothetical protein